jgi:hypothetical protein
MDLPRPAVKTLSISSHGKLSIAPDADAPLLVVFGGIDVDGVQSGVYMWSYMANIKDKFTSSLRSTIT